MTLSDLSIKRPVFTTMVAGLLLVLGLIGISRLGTDLFPDVAIPVVLVQTVYKGAGPQEVESQVTKPLEDAVAGINGVDFMHSYSRDNVGLLVVQFKLTEDIDRAVQEVRDKVAAAQSRLPREADVPQVSRFDIGAQAILTYAVSADLPTQDLRRLLEDRVKPVLSQIDGVAEARITGGDVREVRVNIDLDKAKAAGLAPAQIAQQLGMDNVNVPAGRLEVGPLQLSVRALGEYQTVDQLRAQPIAVGPDGAQVRLDEVAEVVDGVADRTTLARLDGAPAVLLEIIKQPGSNTVQVSDQVTRKLDQLAPLLGHGFKLERLVVQADLIRENAREVWVALIFGGLMAVVIILVFLLDVRGTIISAMALPTSVIGTFFLMYVLGYSMNQLTLLGLSLAIGLLIDDAVVVREAITHRLEEGEPPKRAAAHGTRDVYLAVLATTLALVAVFVPVAFMPGLVGRFFKQFGLTVSAAVLISLFISFTLDPMLSSRFVKRRVPGQARQENRVAAALRRAFDATERGYERLLAAVLSHPWRTAAVSLVVVVVSALAARSLQAEFLPQEDRSQFSVDLQLGDGASLAASTERAAQAEKLIRALPEVTHVFSVVGFNGEANRVRQRVLLTDKRERKKSAAEMKDEVRSALLQALPSTTISMIDPPPIEGAGDFFPIMVRITGKDFQELKKQGERIRQMLLDVPHTADVHLALSPPRPELQVKIDRARAGDLGLSAAALGGQLRLAINGQVVGKLREGTDETDIVVRLAQKDRATPEQVKNIDVFTAQGVRPVSDVAEVTLGDGPSVIEHHDRERTVLVTAGIGRGGALGGVVADLEKKLAAAPLPPGYGYVFDGQVKLFKEQVGAFAFVFALSIIFVYMVLASQFESFKHPFTILVSVPLALIGALLALVLFGYHLSMGAMIGVILLMGLVTKNAILLVDGALQHLRAGKTVRESLLLAGPRRLRPILMTSAAMAIGMLPTAIGAGLGSEFRAPMAVSVIGGVISSTFLTLVVVPVVFLFLERLTPAAWRTGVAELEEHLEEVDEVAGAAEMAEGAADVADVEEPGEGDDTPAPKGRAV